MLPLSFPQVSAAIGFGIFHHLKGHPVFDRVAWIEATFANTNAGISFVIVFRRTNGVLPMVLGYCWQISCVKFEQQRYTSFDKPIVNHGFLANLQHGWINFIDD